MSEKEKELMQCRDLSVTIRRTGGAIVENISFCLERGKNLCIMGESGSGKTTVVNCVAGYDLYAKGLTVQNPVKINRQSTTVFSVCQDADFFLDPYKTLFYYIKRAFDVRDRRNVGTRDKRLDTGLLLDYVCLLGLLKPLFEDNGKYTLETLKDLTSNRSGSLPKKIEKILINTLKSKTKQKLSGGEKQKFFLLLAFIVNPDILVADEIFTDIDDASRNRISNLIFKQDFTVIFISHNIRLVKKLMDQRALTRVYYLKDKTFVPAVWENTGNSTLPPWAEKMIRAHNNIQRLEKKHTTEIDGTVNNGMEIYNIASARKVFRDGRMVKFACRNGNIRLHPGINYAFAGENGAGKTTLFKILAKIYDFKGDILYLHNRQLQKLKNVSRLDFVYKNQLVFQKTGNAVDDNKPVLEYLLSLFSTEQKTQAVEQIHDLFTQFFKAEKVDFILARRFHDLSVGEQRRVLLIQALLQVDHRSVLFIDEAMRGMDIFLKEKLVKYIRGRNLQVFLVTHDCDLVKAVCDRYVWFDYERESATTYLSGPWSMDTFNRKLGGNQ